MFLRLLLESFLRQRRRKLLAGLAILLGTTTVTAMLALATTIGDRIHTELAVYGANILVTPQSEALAVNIGGVNIKPATGNAYLHESDLAKLKTIFWANNITGISPELTFPAEVTGIPNHPAIPTQFTGYWFQHPFGALRTGAPNLHPWWKFQGQWPLSQDTTKGPDDEEEVVVGSNLARELHLKIGDRFHSNITPLTSFRVTGIVSSGDETDNKVLLPLHNAQLMRFGVPASQNANPNTDAVDRIDIAARTKPEDAFARQDPDKLPPKQREIWYCRPYANSIAFQIREAIPNSDAQQVRRVEQSEGKVLARISGLMWLVSAAALLASGFAVSSAMATAVLERRGEIGLMRSLGASRPAIALLFYAETGILAFLGGSAGYLAGSALATLLGARIFPGETPVTLATIFNPVLLPVVVGLALLVAIAGSTPSIRSALRQDPSAVLRANA
jgi:putative ABC transport system permease protein